MLKKLVKNNIKIIINPEKEFNQLKKRTFEDIVSCYLKSILLLALAAGLFNMAYPFLRAVYFNIFLVVEIEYWRLLNYSFSMSTTTAFFYIIAGTFLVFFLSIILRMFIRGMKYTELMKILFYALTPVLLFGWIPQLIASLFIWSAFLFVTGIKLHKGRKIAKDSIEQRN